MFDLKVFFYKCSYSVLRILVRIEALHALLLQVFALRVKLEPFDL